MPDYLAFRRAYYNDLLHVGKGHDDNPPGRGSGRYPYGSGKRPYQRGKTPYSGVNKYISPRARRAQLEVQNVLRVLPIMIPFVNIGYATAVTIDDYLRTRKIDYIKKEGEHEKISQLRKKDHPTPPEEDVKVTNPWFGRNGKINNCVYCTIAMEMRSRGYDVIARSSEKGHTIKEWDKWFDGFKVNETGIQKKEEESRRQWVDRAYDSLCGELEKQGNGSSGYVGIRYDKMLSNGGHAMFWKVENGKVTFYDGQSGKIDPGKVFSVADPSTYRWARLDNLKLKPDITETIRSNPKGNKKR